MIDRYMLSWSRVREVPVGPYVRSPMFVGVGRSVIRSVGLFTLMYYSLSYSLTIVYYSSAYYTLVFVVLLYYTDCLYCTVVVYYSTLETVCIL